MMAWARNAKMGNVHVHYLIIMFRFHRKGIGTTQGTDALVT